MSEYQRNLTELIPEGGKQDLLDTPTTGVSIPDDIAKSFYAKEAPPEQKTQPKPTTVIEPAHAPEDDWIKIDDAEIKRAEKEKFEAGIKAQQEKEATDIEDMLKNVADAEDARIQRLEESGDVSAYVEMKKRYGDSGDSETVENGSAKPNQAKPKASDSDEVDFDPATGLASDALDPEFLDENDEPIKDETDTIDDVNDTDDEVENYDTYEDVVNVLSAAPTLDYSATEPSVVTVLRNRKVKTEIVSSGRFDSKVLGDKAFDNHINRFKQRNYRQVRVPLVNSGILADFVGTGANDLIMMYGNTDQNIPASEYEQLKMQSIIRSIVSTTPKVDSSQLKNIIHHKDYEMMSFGHLCATLDEIIIPHTCEKCNRSFKIKSKPMDLLLNAKDFQERTDDISTAKNAENQSLMAHDVTQEFESGFKVTVGYPSYYEELVALRSLSHYVDTLSQVEAYRLAQMSTSLMYIKSLRLPDGLYANNMYQKFKAIRMMPMHESTTIFDTIDKMVKEVIVPKFGAANVKCPHCGEAIETVTIDSVTAMVFYHTTVVQAERDAMKKSAENGTNQ